MTFADASTNLHEERCSDCGNYTGWLTASSKRITCDACYQAADDYDTTRSYIEDRHTA